MCLLGLDTFSLFACIFFFLLLLHNQKGQSDNEISTIKNIVGAPENMDFESSNSVILSLHAHGFQILFESETC